MSIPRLLSLSLLLALHLCAGPAAPLSAQAPGGRWHADFEVPDPDTHGFGFSIAGNLDYNGDGVGDLVINTWVLNARIFVASGADGTILLDHSGAGDNFGISVAVVPDATGDGVADVLVSRDMFSSSGARVELLSGVDFSVVYVALSDDFGGTQLFGHRLGSAGDTNGDGIADYYVSDKDWEDLQGRDVGAVFLFSGVDFSLLQRIEGDPAANGIARHVAVLGDLDGDGCSDLAVTAGRAGPLGPMNAGLILLHSGRDGSLIRAIAGTQVDQRLGLWGLARCGDFNQDGVPDLAALSYEGGIQIGVDFLSGADGSRLHRSVSPDPWDLAHIFSAGDMDGDGREDVCAISNQRFFYNYRGGMYVYSGDGGGLLTSFTGSPNDDRSIGVDSNFESKSGALGDFDGDGLTEIAALWDGGFDTTAVLVLQLDPFLHLDGREFSVGAGLPLKVEIDFPDADAGLRYAVLVSASGTGPTNLFGVDVPLTLDVLLLRGIQGRAPSFLVDAYGVLDSEGDASATYVPAPALAGRIGTTVYAAAVAYERSGPFVIRSSIARAITITP